MVELAATEGSRLPLRNLFRRLRRHTKALAGDSAVPVGAVRWGGLRRTSPISRRYGYDRGRPIDRHYIEAFLLRWSADIKGHVLEVKEPEYTKAFGHARVTQSDVLDIDRTNRQATIIADLNEPTPLPTEAFDCVIFTQTLQYIFRLENAMRELYRALKPGGVLLMTVPGISPSPAQEERHWGFTEFSIQRLLEDSFGGQTGQICTYGNLLTATAFLYGLSSEELRPDELAARDGDYPLIVAARCVKAA